MSQYWEFPDRATAPRNLPPMTREESLMIARLLALVLIALMIFALTLWFTCQRTDANEFDSLPGGASGAATILRRDAAPPFFQQYERREHLVTFNDLAAAFAAVEQKETAYETASGNQTSAQTKADAAQSNLTQANTDKKTATDELIAAGNAADTLLQQYVAQLAPPPPISGSPVAA